MVHKFIIFECSLNPIMNPNNNLESLFKIPPEYVKEACEVAGDAFRDDPIMILVYPDEEERK
ncbi:MAG: hypothetical protein ACW96S_06120, partial [Promethearchaeota archaeon]